MPRTALAVTVVVVFRMTTTLETGSTPMPPLNRTSELSRLPLPKAEKRNDGNKQRARDLTSFSLHSPCWGLYDFQRIGTRALCETIPSANSDAVHSHLVVVFLAEKSDTVIIRNSIPARRLDGHPMKDLASVLELRCAIQPDRCEGSLSLRPNALAGVR